MELCLFKTYESLSQAVAQLIIDQVERKPDSVLCLAAGDTPRLAYSNLVSLSSQKNVSFQQCTFIGLDEWVGIPSHLAGSCAFFLHEQLFKPLSIQGNKIQLFHSSAVDLESECARMNEIVRRFPIDLMLVGVGLNGHIGFNEPGTPTDSGAHVSILDEITRHAGQKYFSGPALLTLGITLGLRHFLESRTAILIASGTNKAQIVQRAVEGPVSTQVPASLIRLHHNGHVMVDEACYTPSSNPGDA